MSPKRIPPAFQCYASDWLGSTRIALMLPEQEGAYFRLLCHAWADEDCSLPADEKQLALLSRLGPRWKKLRAEIMACFEPHPDRPDRLINARLYAVRKAQEAHAARRSAAGQGAAQRRWQSHANRIPGAPGSQCDGNATGDAKAMRGDGSPSPTPSPSKNHEETSCLKPPLRTPSTSAGGGELAKAVELLQAHAFAREIIDPAQSLRAAMVGREHLVDPVAEVSRFLAQLDDGAVAAHRRAGRSAAKALMNWIGKAAEIAERHRRLTDAAVAASPATQPTTDPDELVRRVEAARRERTA